jgi:adenylate cyclase
MRSGRGLVAFIVVGAVAAAIGIVTYAIGAFEELELSTVDTRFDLRGKEDPRPEVAVVAIDDETFNQLELQWPFPRSVHARLIDRLREDGVKAIVYDVQFTEPTTYKQDNALVEAVAHATRAGTGVVLATEEVGHGGSTRIFGGDEVLRAIGARAGNSVATPDSDGVLRHFPYERRGLKGLAVVGAEEFLGRPVGREGFAIEEGGWNDYAGPPKTIPTYSFSKVLSGEVPAGELAGKVVVIGASAPSLHDVWSTSAPRGDEGNLMAGAEVQANAIATVFESLPLRSSPGWLDVLVILLLTGIATVAGVRLKPLAAFGVAIAAGALYLLIAQLAFDADLVISVVYPLAALIAAAVGILVLQYLRAAFERQRVRFTFSRFVPEEVVDEVLEKGDEELHLGGVRRECTVLFCDLRGFTSFAEDREPTEVVETLNRYLSEMTDAIMDHGGTLVSYMGDGIMAVFGAPIEQDDHADRAIAAAREMLDARLPAFCEWMRENGRGDGFAMGIGLNSGEVMSGQVGSERRMEYTTIGDTTNTASRLEGMTKGSGYPIFIADSTREARRESEPGLVEVGEFEVRGREHLLRVWSFPQPAPEPSVAGEPA